MSRTICLAATSWSGPLGRTSITVVPGDTTVGPVVPGGTTVGPVVPGGTTVGPVVPGGTTVGPVVPAGACGRTRTAATPGRASSQVIKQLAVGESGTTLATTVIGVPEAGKRS